MPQTKRHNDIAVVIEIATALANAPDDFSMDRGTTCVYFGGSRPINPATLYRGVKKGLYPPPDHVGPNSSRWNLGKCREAKKRLATSEAA